MVEQLASDKDCSGIYNKGYWDYIKWNLIYLVQQLIRPFIYTKQNWNFYLLHNRKHVFLLYAATHPNTIQVLWVFQEDSSGRRRGKIGSLQMALASS